MLWMSVGNITTTVEKINALTCSCDQLAGKASYQ